MIAAAVAVHLADQVDGLTWDETGSAGNIFLGRLPSTPDIAVMITVPGAAPELSTLAVAHPQPQALIRGEPNDYRAAHTLAAEVLAALDCYDGHTLDDGGVDEVWLIGSTALQSEPAPLPADDNDRPLFSVNWQFMTSSPSTHRSPV